MIPKQSNQHSSHSPVFSKQMQSTQMQSPGSKLLHINKQNLLDQIISNCQKAQSPSLFSPRKSANILGRVLKCQDKVKDKENFEIKIHNNGSGFGNCRDFVSSGKISQSKGRRDSRVHANQGQNEYFPHPKHNHIPVYTQQPLKQRHPHHPIAFKKLAQPLINCGQVNSSRGKSSHSKIQSIRQDHIDHCRRQQRKIRLYYVQLENKLCEMRNRQLKVLAQYEANKLRQFDETIKNGDCELMEIDKVERGQRVKVNEGIKAEIKGCLWNGMSGVCFSFDQNCIEFQ